MHLPGHNPSGFQRPSDILGGTAVSSFEPVSRGLIHSTAYELRNRTSHLDMSSPTHPPDGEHERVRQSLLSAVEADNVELVGQLFATNCLQAGDATGALGHASTRPAVMRCLLMHGANPKGFDRIERVRSAEVLRLLVEFGYNIRPAGHLIIQ